MAATTVARRTAVRLPSWRAEVIVLVAAAALLAYLTVIPLAMLVLGAMSASGSALDFQFTTRFLERVLTDQASLELLANSVMYAGGAAALAFALGTAVAWTVERTNIPGRSLWYGLALVPLIVPGIVHTIAWLFLLSPEIGWINAPLKAILGLPGRIFVYTSRIYLSLKLYPPSFGLAAAYGLVLLAISVVGLVLHRRATRRVERYATVTGKAFRPRRLELGRARYAALAALGLYAFLAVVLPFLVLLYASFIRVYSVPSLDSLRELTLSNYAFILV